MRAPIRSRCLSVGLAFAWLALVLVGCTSRFPEDAILQGETVAAAQEEYRRAQPFLRRLSTDSDRENATRWLCAAALRDYAPAYYDLAKFYMGVREGADGNLVPAGTFDQDKPKFNVALGLSFLVLARDNTSDPEVARKARHLYRKAVKLVGIEDGMRARKFYEQWYLYRKEVGTRPDGDFHSTQSPMCLWQDATIS